MQKIIATDLETWQRIGISQCPKALLEIIIQCMNPLSNPLSLKIERITPPNTKEKVTEDVLQEENPLKKALTLLKDSSIEHVAVWLRIEPNSLEKFKSRIAKANYELDIQPKKLCVAR